MTKCFHCNNNLSVKKGKRKIKIKLSKITIFVEEENALFCTKCNEHYLSTKQLIDGFVQIGKELKDEKKGSPKIVSIEPIMGNIFDYLNGKTNINGEKMVENDK